MFDSDVEFNDNNEYVDLENFLNIKNFYESNRKEIFKVVRELIIMSINDNKQNAHKLIVDYQSLIVNMITNYANNIKEQNEKMDNLVRQISWNSDTRGFGSDGVGKEMWFLVTLNKWAYVTKGIHRKELLSESEYFNLCKMIKNRCKKPSDVKELIDAGSYHDNNNVLNFVNGVLGEK